MSNERKSLMEFFKTCRPSPDTLPEFASLFLGVPAEPDLREAWLVSLVEGFEILSVKFQHKSRGRHVHSGMAHAASLRYEEGAWDMLLMLAQYAGVQKEELEEARRARNARGHTAPTALAHFMWAQEDHV
jgi:hypothetical protein